MADLATLFTSAQVKPVVHQNAELYDIELPASSAPTYGQAVFLNSSGVATLSDGSAAGTAICDGIIVEIQGRGATILSRGLLYGFNLSALAYGAPVYISDTAGALGGDAGDATVDIIVGKVWRLSDKDATKVLFINCPTNI